ncbi:phage tail protein [Methylococcus sp. S2T]|uniref:phage tail protein n=1 Tax=Methylococcus sp. S2T TaxID=3438967 RepID=UPI003EDA9E01
MAELLQPSLRDARGLALDALIERISRLDQSALLVYLVDQADSSALPHLADQFHVMGLEGWDTVSTDTERRALIKSAIAYHRLKGTLAGLAWAGSRVGLSILRAITPPAKTYLAPTLTRAERDAFLSGYPQLRLYRYRTRGVRIGSGWYCGAAFVRGHHYPVVTDAILRLGWRAFLWHTSGEETPVTTLVREIQRAGAEAELSLAIRKPGSAGLGTYPGRLVPRSYLVQQDGGGRLFNVRLSTPYLDFDESVHTHAVRPGLDPIDIRYTTIAEQGIEHGVMLGRFVAGHLADNGARDRLYRRFHLFDPAVPVPRRGRSTHVGAMKLGMPAYTAELAVSMPARRSPRLIGRFATGYWAPASVSRLERGREAMALAAAFRDRVWLDTHTRKQVRAGYAVRSGEILSGQFITV